MIDQRFQSHPKRKKKARAAARRIKVIAGKIFRDLVSKMDDEQKSRHEKILTARTSPIPQKTTLKL